jgi:hypothetical protein
MSLRRKMRAIVALVAAYAVALQGAFLAIGGPIAGPTNLGASFAASSLCLSSRLGGEHPGPGGPEHDCSAACAACCCSAPAATAPAAVTAYEMVPAGLIGATIVIAPTWRFDAGRAHRSRAPPLG